VAEPVDIVETVVEEPMDIQMLPVQVQQPVPVAAVVVVEQQTQLEILVAVVALVYMA
jgi:hypothetical protein